MANNRLLLDTCAVIWLFNGEPMADKAREAIAAAAAVSQLHVSPISAWEIGMLVAKGRIALSMPPAEWLSRVWQQPGIQVAEMTPQPLVESSFLPGPAPKDPADRIIIATARLLNLTVVTRDRSILDYAQQGHVAVLRC